MRDRNQPMYLISVVAELLSIHPQTLRLYEREGLINPKRVNKQRLYSDEDIEQLRFIIELTRDLGVNKAGVDIILRMRQKMIAIQWEMEGMLRSLDEEPRRSFEQRIRKIFSI